MRHVFFILRDPFCYTGASKSIFILFKFPINYILCMFYSVFRQSKTFADIKVKTTYHFAFKPFSRNICNKRIYFHTMRVRIGFQFITTDVMKSAWCNFNESVDCLIEKKDIMSQKRNMTKFYITITNVNIFLTFCKLFLMKDCVRLKAHHCNLCIQIRTCINIQLNSVLLLFVLSILIVSVPVPLKPLNFKSDALHILTKKPNTCSRKYTMLTKSRVLYFGESYF